jgi:hypothetical protein
MGWHEILHYPRSQWPTSKHPQYELFPLRLARVNPWALQRDLLYTDGYIACMIGPGRAPRYFSQLLRVNEHTFQLIVSNGIFLLLHPAVPNVHPITHIGNRPAWLLDYMLQNVGTVIPQRLWSPTTTSDAQRYGTVPLNMPIFFVQRDRTTLGLPLNLASSGNCSALVNARHPAPVGPISTLFVRIMVSRSPKSFIL